MLLLALSAAGKPIWCSDPAANAESLSPLAAMTTALLGLVESFGGGDELRTLRLRDGNRIAVTTVGEVVLLAVGRAGETAEYLVAQLRWAHDGMLVVLTSGFHKRLAANSKSDLRDLLGTGDGVMRSLVGADTDGAGPQAAAAGAPRRARDDPDAAAARRRAEFGTSLGCGCQALPLAPEARGGITAALASAQSQLPELLYGFVCAGDRLVALTSPGADDLRTRSADVLLLSHFVRSQPALRRALESWTPVCLPRFNATGFLNAYVAFADADSELWVILVSAQATSDAFLSLQRGRAAVEAAIDRDGGLAAVRAAVAKERRHPTAQDYARAARASHFVFAHRAPAAALGLRQYMASSLGADDDPRRAARVRAAYQRAAARLRRGTAADGLAEQPPGLTGPTTFEADAANSMCCHCTEREVVAATAGADFELYATFPFATSAADALARCNRLARALRRDSAALFVSAGAVY